MKYIKTFVAIVLCCTLLLPAAACGKKGNTTTQNTEDTTQSTTDGTSAQDMSLYVAPGGSDTGDGTEAAPFATLTAAIREARKYTGTVTISLRAGIYTAEETIALTAEDSNLIIRAYPGETVTYTGASEIPYSAFTEVSDQKIVKRFASSSAAKKIKTVNLKTYGITDLGSMKVNGKIESGEAGYPSTLSYQGEYMTVAQYPNGDEFLKIDRVIESGYGGAEVMDGLVAATYTLADFTRYKKWTAADDIWSIGYVCALDSDVTAPASVSADGQVTSLTTKKLGAQVGQRVKFIHVLEELDTVGEWYLDYETGDLYVYPPKEMQASESFFFNTYDKTFFSIDGAQNITFENLAFSGTTATMFDIKNASGIVFDACDISDAGEAAVWFAACTDSGIKNSYLHDLGAYGVAFYQCGDKATLTAGNCFVENTEFARFSQHKRTYTPAVYLFEDVGNRVSHCLFYDSPHEAVEFASNDAVIEYNEIYEVCKETADAGAIYAQGYYNAWGNVIRYNYIHHIKNELSGGSIFTNGVYLAGLFSSAEIYGNVFYECGALAKIAGGRNNRLVNNVGIFCEGFVEINQIGVQNGTTSAMKNSDKVDWHTDVWVEKYPALAELAKESSFELGKPKNNEVRYNVLFNAAAAVLSDYASATCTVERNYNMRFQEEPGQKERDLFVKDVYSRLDVLLPEFETIPFDEIGLIGTRP